HRDLEREAQGFAAAIPLAELVPIPGQWAGRFGNAIAIEVMLEFLTGGASNASAGYQSRLASGAFRTVLFTDIEGHTEMIDKLGDERGREVLRQHERITREALRAHGGTEVKTMGDGFMACFGSAREALDCAIALQKAMDARNQDGAAFPLRVRAGVNAGEPISEDDDLFGVSVIAAARIMSKAQGGQIIVSDVVRQLVAGKGFAFVEHGETTLRGFEEPVRLYELRWRD
ncbi:MAG TPA: adenylate/guanylate cyclase domain-containing protein, partial [Dehalococcoidia bacterium]